MTIPKELIARPTWLFPSFQNNFNQVTQLGQNLFLSFVVLFIAAWKKIIEGQPCLSPTLLVYTVFIDFFSMIYHLFSPQTVKFYTSHWNNPRELKRNKPLFRAFKEFSLVFFIRVSIVWLRNVCLSKLLRKAIQTGNWNSEKWSVQ